jgi:hypothetical protein
LFIACQGFVRWVSQQEVTGKGCQINNLFSWSVNWLIYSSLDLLSLHQMV